MRYFLEIAYNGKQYAGWQVQKGKVTVQSVMENALSTILQQDIAVTGCGRTDAGVHATQFYLHFDADRKTSNLVYKLNSFLPKDIAVYDIIPVAGDAHARFDATERSYHYFIYFEKNPFLDDFGCYYPYPGLNLESMNRATELLLTYDEFAPFCKRKSGAKTMKCDIKKAEWVYDEDNRRLHFYITADRFLRGMVRLIAGCMLRIGRGKISLDDFKRHMEEQTRIKHILSAPPEGLYLSSVRYPYINDDMREAVKSPNFIFEESKGR